MNKRVVILSRNPALHSTARLEQAARERDLVVRVIDYTRCVLTVSELGPMVYYQGEPVRADVIIPRIGASHTVNGTAVVRHFELCGVDNPNPAAGITASRDKITAMQTLIGAGLPVPRTAAGGTPRENGALIASVGGAPVVVKLIEGTHGAGVVLAESDASADAVVSAMRAAGGQVLVQQFVRDADGSDIRAFIVGGRVVGAMKRQAPPGEFRANLHLGGTARRIRLSDTERDLALRAAAAFGLNIAGVDLLRTANGPVVLEINNSPGLEGIEEATGINIADRIMEFIQFGTLDRYSASHDDSESAPEPAIGSADEDGAERVAAP